MSSSVHLVIPCFQESGRISRFLAELCDETARLGGVTIRVVEDGSGEQEAKRMREIIAAQQARSPHLVAPLMLAENLGKGGAVHAAWREEKSADWLAFVDADGSCSAAEVSRLIQLARESPPRTALFASRVKMLGKSVERHFRRHLLGRVYATLVSELLDIPVYDSQCGLKLVPRACFEAVEARLKITGFAFDVELLTALLDSGCAVHEVPISWHETPGGKVRLLRDSFLMARDVLKIKAARGSVS
ncbi:MAG: glycosyltransferase [Verrucomicrobiaceae bacterium]|nr:glycosyltransferase [Verrucomicrobiaceae bacterium]